MDLHTFTEPSAEVVLRIERIWSELRLDDDRLRDHQVQAELRDACTEQLGQEWAQLCSALRVALVDGPHWAVIRSVVERPSPALLAALAVAIGHMSDPHRSNGARVLQEIPHKPVWTDDLEWHTDGTGWQRPNDVTVLMCLRSAPSGGATDLLSLDTARAACAARAEQAAIETMAAARFAWPVEEDLGGGKELDWIITPDRIRFFRRALLATTDETLREAVRAFCATIDDLPPDASVLLEPGDVMLFDNNRCIHRRGVIDDPRRERLLLRTRINYPVTGRAEA